MRAKAESWRRSLRPGTGGRRGPSTTTSDATAQVGPGHVGRGCAAPATAHRGPRALDESETHASGRHRADRSERVGGGPGRRPQPSPASKSPAAWVTSAASRTSVGFVPLDRCKQPSPRASTRGSGGPRGPSRTSSTSTPSTWLTSFDHERRASLPCGSSTTEARRSLARPTFEDVDPDQVTAHRTDPGWQPPRARPACPVARPGTTYVAIQLNITGPVRERKVSAVNRGVRRVATHDGQMGRSLIHILRPPPLSRAWSATAGGCAQPGRCAARFRRARNGHNPLHQLPKPTPGEVATRASVTRYLANSSDPISRYGSGTCAQTNMVPTGLAPPIRCG